MARPDFEKIRGAFAMLGNIHARIEENRLSLQRGVRPTQKSFVRSVKDNMALFEIVRYLVKERDAISRENIEIANMKLWQPDADENEYLDS